MAGPHSKHKRDGIHHIRFTRPIGPNYTGEETSSKPNRGGSSIGFEIV